MNINAFPEIAKAVGTHKYVRRIAVPGGGYRYIYKEPAPGVHGPSFGEAHSRVSESIGIAAEHARRGDKTESAQSIREAFGKINKWEKAQRVMIKEAGQKKYGIYAHIRGTKTREQKVKAQKRLKEQAGEMRSLVQQAQKKILRGQFAGAEKLTPKHMGVGTYAPHR